MIAALFVERGGVYFNLPDVDPWDEARDARHYAGPHRVIAHPPCARWGRYWYGGPELHRRGQRLKLGDDNGCFAAALAAVRRWGGVLEHPEASHAWAAHGLAKPRKSGGWICVDHWGGWTCCVEQGHYGHRARKATWLYACAVPIKPLQWGPCEKKARLYQEFHSKEERRRGRRSNGLVERLSKKETVGTPIEFRDLLISMVSDDRRSV